MANIPTLDPHTAALLIAGVLFIYIVHRVMTGQNQLQWWQFIATRGKDKNFYADLDKLGKAIGIIVASWVMVKVADADKLDLMGFAAVLAAYLAFVGGTAFASAYLRTQDRGSRDDREDKGK